MTALVTGGTGFVGSHVVRVLLERGERVLCLVREGSRRDNLEGLAVEPVVGDLLEPETYGPSLRQADVVYHCAADYRLGLADPEPMYRTNVEGTDRLLAAAAAADVARVVHCSSVGALGLEEGGGIADEETPVTLDDMIGDYKRSKFQGERVAESWVERGLPVVIVNPSTPVGERDIKPTPTGQIIVDFLNRKMPAYVDTGMNLVDVRDVAAGHVLAAERGEPGRRYILGNRNLSLREMLETLAGLTGLPAPRVRLPHWVPMTAAAIAAAVARVTGRRPALSMEAVRMSRHHMYFDATRAVRELGLPQSPVEDALDRAMHWFRDNGYVRPS